MNLLKLKKGNQFYFILCLVLFATNINAQLLETQKQKTQQHPTCDHGHDHGGGCAHHERIIDFEHLTKGSINQTKSLNPALTPPTNIQYNIEGPNHIHLTWDKSTGCPDCSYLVILNDSPTTNGNHMYIGTAVGTQHIGFHRKRDMTQNMPNLGESFNVYVAAYDRNTNTIGSYAQAAGGATSFGWRTLGQSNNDINFSFVGWTNAQKSTLYHFVNRMKPIIKNIYGPPARSIDVEITNSNLGPYYDAISNRIHIHEDRVMGQNGNTRDFHLLVHEILHAWRDNYGVTADADFFYDPLMSGYEEGFAQIGAYDCLNEYVKQYANYADVTGTGARNETMIFNSSKTFNYDLSNQQALTAGALHSSFAYNRGITNERYDMAAAGLKKIDIEKPGFFAAFNNSYYQSLNQNNTTLITRPFVENLIAGYVPTIEGEPTSDWLSKQHVLKCETIAGKKLFMRPSSGADYAYVNNMVFTYYETFANGNDPWEANLNPGADYYFNGPDYNNINHFTFNHLNGTTGNIKVYNNANELRLNINPSMSTTPSNGYGRYGITFSNWASNNFSNPEQGFWGENTELGLYRVETTFGTKSSTNYVVTGTALQNNNGITGGVINGNGGSIELKHENFPAETALPITNGAFFGTRNWSNIPNAKTGGFDSAEGQLEITYTDADGNQFQTFRNIDIGNGYGSQTFILDVDEMEPLSGSTCETAPASDIQIHTAATGQVRWRTTAYVGIQHKYRHRVQGTNTWTTLSASNQTFRYVGYLPECTSYEVQMQVYCSESLSWSDWSATKVLTVKPRRPGNNTLSSHAYSNFAYLYCNYHNDDKKQFLYWKDGAYSTTRKWKTTTGTEHYVPTESNLEPNTLYRFMVRRKCGTTGAYSFFSAQQTFTTSGTQGRVEQPEDVEFASALKQDAKILCSPNPSNGQFTLSGDLVKVGNELSIHNLMGTLVEKHTINDDINVELSMKLQAGTYFLSIVDKNTGRMVSERIVIQNL